MELLRWKMIIAILWLFMVATISAHSNFFYWEPGGIDRMIYHIQEEGSGVLLFEALGRLIPLWMAFITLILKHSYNKWLNFVLGIAFTIFNIWHFFSCGIPLSEGGPVTEPSAHHILILGSTVVATALIAWYAWKLPKVEIETGRNLKT